MPISDVAQKIIELDNNYGVKLDPTLRYSLVQLQNINNELAIQKKSFSDGAEKLINEVTDACMGGHIAPSELTPLIQKLIDLAFKRSA